MSGLPPYALPDDARLEALRVVGDPPADDAVRAIFERGQVAAVNRLIVSLVRDDAAALDSLPDPARAFFAETGALPPWADAALIARGQSFFGRHAPRAMLILSHYSLPACYAARKGVQVLAMTNRLARNPRPRLLETAQFVFDVMAPGALMRGDGVRSAQKVRLMHAAVRHLILEHGWDQELGLPVNQEDMLGTLLTFSAVILDGLRKLGFVVAEADAHAYLHTWNVIGALMGVRYDLLPPDVRAADMLMLAIERRHVASCPEGRELAAALLAMLQEANPGTPFAAMPASMMRFFLGDTRADVLGLPPADWTRELTAPLRLVGRLTGEAYTRLPVLAAVSERLGYTLMDRLIRLEHPGRRAEFRMPEALR
jgi:hypothetical protein